METIEDLDLFDMISYILSPISNDLGFSYIQVYQTDSVHISKSHL